MIVSMIIYSWSELRFPVFSSRAVVALMLPAPSMREDRMRLDGMHAGFRTMRSCYGER